MKKEYSFFSLRFIVFIAAYFLLASCNEAPSTEGKGSQRSTLLDTLKKECRSARLMLFRDFATSKISLLLKEAKDQKSIDSLFSFIGGKKIDTSCYLLSGESPVGEIYFYRDTAMKEELADLFFTLDSKCNGWYSSIHRDAAKFDLTPKGKVFLTKTRDRVRQAWKK